MQNQFKNMQVLDFESHKELKKYMKSISKDLGVRCTFCHDLNDKSIDTPQKIITREMIKMHETEISKKNTSSKPDKSADTPAKEITREMIKMQENINNQLFKMREDTLTAEPSSNQVTCWTCHRGFSHPELIRTTN